jgi:CDP-diacylglycerol---glycerol-3-phosphate 3-phosphatidyltransferase
MQWLKQFKKRHPDLFTYQKSDVVHPHDIFLRRSLLRMLPKGVTPNQLTLFRIIATPVVFLLILRGFYFTGVIFFLFVALTDALDGSLARTGNKITKFGIMFDPLADKLLIGSMVLLLVFQHLGVWLGITVLGLEILFIMLAFASNVKFKTVRAANRWGKIKMLLQVLAVFLILLALLLDFPVLLSFASMIFGIAIGFAVLSLFTKGA